MKLRWVKGSELAKGDVFAIGNEDGLGLAIRVRKTTKKEMHIELFDMDNEWKSLESPVPLDLIGEMDFVKFS